MVRIHVRPPFNCLSATAVLRCFAWVNFCVILFAEFHIMNTKLIGLGGLFALPSDLSLGDKLGAMSAMELRCGILGASIWVEPGHQVLSSECVDDVLGATAAGIALMEHAATIPSLTDLLEEERLGALEAR